MSNSSGGGQPAGGPSHGGQWGGQAGSGAGGWSGNRSAGRGGRGGGRGGSSSRGRKHPAYNGAKVPSTVSGGSATVAPGPLNGNPSVSAAAQHVETAPSSAPQSSTSVSGSVPASEAGIFAGQPG